jgi:diguanylate cyclase
MSPHRDWSRRPLSLILALLIASSAALLFASGLFSPVEDALTNQRAEMLSRPPTGQTVIVEIDAKSLAELRSWPWPRSYHAAVVGQLHKSGASIIAFDVDFSAPSSRGDEDFARAIREAGHVVLPIFSQQASANGIGDARVLANRPDAIFADAWVGGVNIFPDGDGVVRDYPAATFIDGAVQPSIATLVAEKDGMGDRTFQPDWAIEAERIPRLSFADVMAGRVRADEIRGKRILIGATAIELGDRYAVPRQGVVPGVVVQALAAESLIQGRAIQRTSSAVSILGILLIAFLLAPRPVDRPVRYGALCVAIALTVLAGPVVAQWLWPISVESAPWLFTLLGAIALQAAVEARRRLRLRAQIDADSGLPNRSVLEEALNSGAGGAPFLVTAGIERFETIRDGIGLAATNELIRNAAEAIGTLVGSTVYRIAPDVLAWAAAESNEAAVEAGLRKVQAIFRAPVGTRAGSVDIALTIGLDRNCNGAAVLRIERALSAITSARSAGKPHEWYRGADPQLRRQLSMMSDLRVGMEKGQLGLAYQAKMSLATGRISDAEALIRWHDENGRTVSPDEFIPLAEATGVIREVTMYALRAAMSDLARWTQQGAPMRVAVNVSALDLATEDFAEEVARMLRTANVPTSQLTLEVTESALIRSPAEAVATLAKLRESGVRLAVDDYGTGQSTLSYLKHLPVHELKIDKSFVTTLATSENDAIMVRSTINLAHDLGLQVVAEGIEDSATLDKLRDLQCDYAQGYFISKPVGPDEFFALATRRDEGRRIA